jgi:hypothetical protein
VGHDQYNWKLNINIIPITTYMDATSLEKQASQSPRSAVIYLENNSSADLKFLDSSLNNGQWIQEPVSSILAEDPATQREKEWAVWASISNNDLTGAVRYRLFDPNPTDDCEQITDLSIAWHAPGMGSDDHKTSVTIAGKNHSSLKYELIETILDLGRNIVIKYSFKHK